MRLGILVLLAACTGPAAHRATGDAGGGGGGGGDAGGGSSSDAGGGGSAGVGPYFHTPMFWNRDVSALPKAANSDAVIAALVAAGGWGGGKMQIDYGLDVLAADASTPHLAFTTTSDFYSPDCDHVPVPVPTGGNLEGETGYNCTTNGDCHLLVHDTAGDKLYEMWRADFSTGSFQGGCLAVWNLAATYGDALRGDQCTSADAAGFPLSPLVFTADEVASGHLDHAIRFILPNNHIKKGYVRPATHGTSTTGSTTAPPYGVHLRLRADYPIAQLPAGARVVARALQTYGMYQADGGTVALTAQSDRHTTAKWAGLLGAGDLGALKVTDFEVIDHGPMIVLTGDCAR
jgi:serine/threonine-protein kinase